MKTRISTIVFALIFITTAGIAQTHDAFFQKADAFFKSSVVNGRVKYATVKKDPSALNALVKMVAEAKVDKSNTAVFQAFHINAYNISVIKGIVEAYPVGSPMKINGFFDGKKHTIAGKSTTLNNLENKVLRANYPNEPRFHFALVCAGLGCPPIIAEAYLPSKLDKQLARQTKLAINNAKFTKYNSEKGKIQLSQIFEWYKGDFTKNGQSLVDFVNKYRSEQIPSKTKVGFYTYDWTLNDAK